MMDEMQAVDQENNAYPAGEKVPGQAESRKALRKFLEDLAISRCPWWDDYNRLRAEGWDWRKAAYIAWAASPVLNRWPDSQEKLAKDVLGLRSDRTIRKWRENDALIDERVAKMQIEPLMRHRADVIHALVAMASTPDPKTFQDRRMFLEMTGDYRPRGANTNLDLDLGVLSDEQLERIAAGEDPVHVLATTSSGKSGD